MLVDRPERSAAVDPNVRRSKPVPQSRERGDLIETPVRLPEDELSIGLTEMSDRNAIRQRSSPVGIKAFQYIYCDKKRIVATRRAE
jgi:hypothetical protein